MGATTRHMGFNALPVHLIEGTITSTAQQTTIRALPVAKSQSGQIIRQPAPTKRLFKYQNTSIPQPLENR